MKYGNVRLKINSVCNRVRNTTLCRILSRIQAKTANMFHCHKFTIKEYRSLFHEKIFSPHFPINV